MRYTPFRMERWQSTYENQVEINLSESGVHPLTVGELLELAGEDPRAVGKIPLGYGHSNGSPELRRRISALYPGVTEEGVLVTVGGAEANLCALWHLVEEGRPAAVMLPNYMQVPGMAENFGAQVLPFWLREESGWQPDLGDLETLLRRGAHFILVTNPNNPTGARLSEASVEGIVKLAEEYGAWILADEVYQGAEVDGRTTPSFWGRTERVLVTQSLSKAYGLPGLRLGWVVGPPGVVTDLWGRTDYTTIAPSVVSDHLATLALTPPVRERILARTRRILQENLAVLEEWVARQGGLFRYRPPDAGAIAYLRYTAPVNSSEIAEKLRAEKGVLVVPGDHFGMDRYLRVGIGLPKPRLAEGLRRLAESFREVAG